MPCPRAEIDHVPDDEEIAGKPEPRDEIEFAIELRKHRRAEMRVTRARAGQRHLAQK